jgi:hypothetical protein
MAFNGFGNFPASLKYNGKLGGLSVENGEKLQISTVIIFDYVQAEVCWMQFLKGQPPSFYGAVPFTKMHEHGDPPDDDVGRLKEERHKRGIKLPVFVTDRGTYEFASGALGCCQSTEGIITEAIAFAEETGTDELPLVKYGGDEHRKWKHGDGFAPKLNIVGWIPRPGSLPLKRKLLAQAKAEVAHIPAAITFTTSSPTGEPTAPVREPAKPTPSPLREPAKPARETAKPAAGFYDDDIPFSPEFRGAGPFDNCDGDNIAAATFRD